MRLSGPDALAARASKRLKGDELLVTGFAVTRLRMELDRVPLWRGDQVPIKQIVEDFARYLYLPHVGKPSQSDGSHVLQLRTLRWMTPHHSSVHSRTECDAWRRFASATGVETIEWGAPLHVQVALVELLDIGQYIPTEPAATDLVLARGSR